MKNNIILIGYMGCGKSTVGKALASRNQQIFLDTDVCIEQQEGCAISNIFAQKGEGYFRDLEAKLLQKMVEENANTLEKERENVRVISVGGGLPLREENRVLLRQLGTVIYLKAKPDTIYERLKGDTTRPLLQTENPREKIKEMLESREGKYQAAAHNIMEVDGKKTEEIVEEIRKMLRKG